MAAELRSPADCFDQFASSACEVDCFESRSGVVVHNVVVDNFEPRSDVVLHNVYVSGDHCHSNRNPGPS